MICEMSSEEIFQLVNHQISAFWPGKGIESSHISSLYTALKRVEKNFQQRNSLIYQKEGKAVFDVCHSVQYSIFLYTYANQLYLDGNESEAACVYYLNKIMHSVDWFYAVKLPEYFGAEHPLGSIVGRAEIGDYLFLYQGTTIGGNRKDGQLYYPVTGHHVLMYSDSKILGNSVVGNYVIISANTYVLDSIIPDNSIVFGQSPNLVIKQRTEDEMKDKMKPLWNVL